MPPSIHNKRSGGPNWRLRDRVKTFWRLADRLRDGQADRAFRIVGGWSLHGLRTDHPAVWPAFASGARQ